MKIKKFILVLMLILFMPVIFYACKDNNDGASDVQEEQDIIVLPERPVAEDNSGGEVITPDKPSEDIDKISIKINVHDAMGFDYQYVAYNIYNETYDEIKSENCNQTQSFTYDANWGEHVVFVVYLPNSGGIKNYSVNSSAENYSADFNIKQFYLELESIREAYTAEVYIDNTFNISVDKNFYSTGIATSYNFIEGKNLKDGDILSVVNGGEAEILINDLFDYTEINKIELSNGILIERGEDGFEDGDGYSISESENVIHLHIDSINKDINISLYLKDIDVTVYLYDNDLVYTENNLSKKIYNGGTPKDSNLLMLNLEGGHNFAYYYYTTDNESWELVPFNEFYYRNGSFYYPITDNCIITKDNGAVYSGEDLRVKALPSYLDIKLYDGSNNPLANDITYADNKIIINDLSDGIYRVLYATDNELTNKSVADSSYSDGKLSVSFNTNMLKDENGNYRERGSNDIYLIIEEYDISVSYLNNSVSYLNNSDVITEIDNLEFNISEEGIIISNISSFSTQNLIMLTGSEFDGLDLDKIEDVKGVQRITDSKVLVKWEDLKANNGTYYLLLKNIIPYFYDLRAGSYIRLEDVNYSIEDGCIKIASYTNGHRYMLANEAYDYTTNGFSNFVEFGSGYTWENNVVSIKIDKDYIINGVVYVVRQSVSVKVYSEDLTFFYGYGRFVDRLQIDLSEIYGIDSLSLYTLKSCEIENYDLKEYELNDDPITVTDGIAEISELDIFNDTIYIIYKK